MITQEEIEEEIRALVRDHGSHLMNFVRRRGVPEHLVGEVLNDALLALASKRLRGKPVPKPVEFLFVVARNAATDLLRGLYAMEVPDSDAVGEAEAPDPLEAFELTEDLDKAIGQLPERQRQVIELRFRQGYDVAETARIMGVADGTIGPMTTKARRNLKRIIEEQGGSWEVETL